MVSCTADSTQLKRELDLQGRAEIINQIALKIRKRNTKCKGLEDKIRLNCLLAISVGERIRKVKEKGYSKRS